MKIFDIRNKICKVVGFQTIAVDAFRRPMSQTFERTTNIFV